MPANHSDCRQGIHGDRLPVAGHRYTTKVNMREQHIVATRSGNSFLIIPITLCRRLHRVLP